jgi:hypothetical protein
VARSELILSSHTSSLIFAKTELRKDRPHLEHLSEVITESKSELVLPHHHHQGLKHGACQETVSIARTTLVLKPPLWPPSNQSVHRRMITQLAILVP